MSAIKMRSQAKKIPMWGFAFTAAVEARAGDSGNSFVPTFSGIVELEGEDQANMTIIREQLAGEDIQNAAGDDDHSGSVSEPEEDKEDF